MNTLTIVSELAEARHKSQFGSLSPLDFNHLHDKDRDAVEDMAEAAGAIVSRLGDLVRDIERELSERDMAGKGGKAASGDKGIVSARIDCEGWFTEIADIATALAKAMRNNRDLDMLSVRASIESMLYDCVVYALVRGEWIDHHGLLLSANDALDEARRCSRYVCELRDDFYRRDDNHSYVGI